MKRFFIATWMLAFFPALGLASEASPPGHPPNVLLITIDTLRADHLSCYGYSRQTSPNLDRLASEGVLFENAYSAIPLTGPSHISMMTGLFPQQHGATVNGAHIGTDMHTKRSPVMLAEVLHRLLKYRTAAFVSAWPLKKGITGLGRGFETYNQKLEYHYNILSAARYASDVGPLSRKWLSKRTQHEHFFLWVHYFDPHAPYELHSEFSNLPSNSSQAALPSSGDAEENPPVRAYDSEIAFTDNDIGKTLKLLDEQGLRKNTLIYVVADHGEALGEHGYVGHGHHVYQPIVHVPMIISYPALLPQGKSIAQDVSLVDLMPTVLDYVGIKMNLPISGRSLRAVIEGKGGATATQPTFFLTYSEPLLHLPRWITWIWSWAGSKRTPSRLGFVKGDVKVISRGGDSVEVLQLRDQFQVERSVDDDNVPSAEAKKYREYLTTWFKQTNTGLPVENHMTEQDKDMLRSLGYVP